MYIKRLLFISIMLCLSLSMSAQTNGKGMDYKGLSQTFTRSKEKTRYGAAQKCVLTNSTLSLLTQRDTMLRNKTA